MQTKQKECAKQTPGKCPPPVTILTPSRVFVPQAVEVYSSTGSLTDRKTYPFTYWVVNKGKLYIIAGSPFRKDQKLGDLNTEINAILLSFQFTGV